GLEQERQVGAGRHGGRRDAPAEQAARAGPGQDRVVAADAQPGALPQAQDRYVVLLEELLDPLLPGLALVRAPLVGIQVVRVQLERDQAERRQRGHLHDRHVVGGSDGRAGHVRARAGPQVGHAAADRVLDVVQHVQPAQGPQQAERVAAADEERLGLAHRPGRVARLMQAVHPDADAEAGQRFAHEVGVGGRVAAGEGYEHDPAAAAQDGPDGAGGVLEERLPGCPRVGQQQQFGHRRTVAGPAPGAVTPGQRACQNSRLAEQNATTSSSAAARASIAAWAGRYWSRNPQPATPAGAPRPIRVMSAATTRPRWPGGACLITRMSMRTRTAGTPSMAVNSRPATHHGPAGTASRARITPSSAHTASSSSPGRSRCRVRTRGAPARPPAAPAPRARPIRPGLTAWWRRITMTTRSSPAPIVFTAMISSVAARSTGWSQSARTPASMLPRPARPPSEVPSS